MNTFLLICLEFWSLQVISLCHTQHTPAFDFLHIGIRIYQVHFLYTKKAQNYWIQTPTVCEWLRFPNKTTASVVSMEKRKIKFPGWNSMTRNNDRIKFQVWFLLVLFNLQGKRCSGERWCYGNSFSLLTKIQHHFPCRASNTESQARLPRFQSIVRNPKAWHDSLFGSNSAARQLRPILVHLSTKGR